MAARDDLIAYAASTRTVTADGLEPHLDRVEREAELRALRAAAARLYAEFPADPEIGGIIDPDRTTTEH